MEPPKVVEINVQSPSQSPSEEVAPAEDDGLEEWPATFSMRTASLNNFPTTSLPYRATYRSQSNSINRAKMGCITNTTKSLNTLRQALQRNLNKEIHEVIQKYLDNFFRPAVENIKQNNGTTSVSEHHLQSVCQKILEEAKKMYFVGLIARCQSPMRDPGGGNNLWDSDHENLFKPAAFKKRRNPSDSESEDCPNSLEPIKANKVGRKKKKLHHNHSAPQALKASPSAIRAQIKTTNSDSIVRIGHRWDPNRLTTETKFVLGSKANKALGFGMTRGRLYTKHADLFRYIGDQEDKAWLSERGLMPPAGGRAYLLIQQDIEDLINTDEYKGMPGVNSKDMGSGFVVTERIISKMKKLMDTMRTKSPEEFA